MTGTYRAAVCTALTGPDAIEIRPQTVTPLAPGQARVAVRAAGISFPDLLMTKGEYQFRPDPPFVPGSEFAGEVIELAEGVTDFALGDRVMGGHKGGCFAEQIAVPAAALTPLPSALSFEEGACWYSAAITAWHGLHDRADIQAGESLLVLGASGGVGMAAVKLAKHMGAAVIAVASTPEKRDAVLAAGADHALDPADPDLAKQVKALTAGKGAAVIFDPVGGDLAITATRAIAVGGRYLIVGFASGVVPNFPANHALIKEYSLIGMRAGESSRRDPDLGQRTRSALAQLARNGVMRPHISHRFSLDDLTEALRTLERKEVVGRAVLKIR
ncbi:NADPH:quinone oxidoreductase family protein [Sphingorhabdus arenilitoris]|uniref:NADPH:quinone oxidoreductase family protein n=1 Tax=Sphingorhabdus arenilitoris TaxID=1490041 RepID=A0ABV8RGP7_9SPHN